MVHDLPENIQIRVKHFLNQGDFVTAKQLHDVFFKNLEQSKVQNYRENHESSDEI